MVKSKIPEKKDIVIIILVEPGTATPVYFAYKAYTINEIENNSEKKPSRIPKYNGFKE